MTTIPESVAYLMKAGIKEHDAVVLRRASMTLQRWHEGECGFSDNLSSWSIVRGQAPKREFYRDPETQAPKWRTVGEFVYDDNGKPYKELHVHTENKPRYAQIPDREKGARVSIDKIMESYPDFIAYIQTDPRGAALYIVPKSRIPAGADLDTCYSNGLAVYR